MIKDKTKKLITHYRPSGASERKRRKQKEKERRNRTLRYTAGMRCIYRVGASSPTKVLEAKIPSEPLIVSLPVRSPS